MDSIVTSFVASDAYVVAPAYRSSALRFRLDNAGKVQLNIAESRFAQITET